MRTSLLILATISGFLTLAGAGFAESAQEDTRTMIATGTGNTPKEALTNSFTIAVEQAVGTLVEAQTIVRENEAIQEQIITASNGFIKGYDILREWKADGLARCKIEARVQVRELRQKLEAANISTIAVSGTNLAARIQTQQAAAQGGAQLLAKRLDDFPNRVLRIVSAGEPVLSEQAGVTRLKIPAILSVDQDAYKKEVAELAAVLEKFAIFKLSARLKFPRGPEYAKEAYGIFYGPHGRFAGRDFFKANFRDAPADGRQSMQTLRGLKREAQEKLDRLDQPACMIIVWQPVLSTGSTGVDFYALDAAVISPLASRGRSSIVVRTALLDAKGQEIDASEATMEPETSNGMFVLNTEKRDYHLRGRNALEMAQINLMPGMNFDPFGIGDGRVLVTSWQGELIADIESAALPQLCEVKLSARWKTQSR